MIPRSHVTKPVNAYLCDSHSRSVFRLYSKESFSFSFFQVEMLYQRYFLRMNQSNTVHIVWLLLALIFILALIHLVFTFILQQSLESCPGFATDPLGK